MKHLFGINSGHTKILGLGWNKIIESYIACICDPLGLISAFHIIWKLITVSWVILKIPWDEEIPDILQSEFKKWVQDISSNKITTGYSA